MCDATAIAYSCRPSPLYYHLEALHEFSETSPSLSAAFFLAISHPGRRESDPDNANLLGHTIIGNWLTKLITKLLIYMIYFVRSCVNVCRAWTQCAKLKGGRSFGSTSYEKGG
jgi:hypothetical protein